jgi:hypothetical protein
MNENLENAVASLLTETLKGVESTKEFLVSETPEVIQQLLTWNLCLNIILIIIYMVLVYGKKQDRD